MGALVDLAVQLGINQDRMPVLSDYDRFWHENRKDAKRVLVISKGHSASLRMWLEFFPNAVLYGIGGEKRYTQEILGFSHRYHPFFIEEQDTVAVIRHFLKEIRGRFNFIVDEGEFPLLNQKEFLVHFLARLEMGSFYVFEGGSGANEKQEVSSLEELRQVILDVQANPPGQNSSELARALYQRLISVVFCKHMIMLQVGLKEFTFDEAYYLEQNPDVNRAVMSGGLKSGLDHYMMFGVRETRPWRLVTPKFEVKEEQF